MLPAEFEICVPSDMKIKGNSVFPTLSVDQGLIRTILSSSISPYPFLPPPVLSVGFGIVAFRWCISVKGMLGGIHEMLGVGWLPYQLSYEFDDVSIPVFDRTLVIVIASHIVDSL